MTRIKSNAGEFGGNVPANLQCGFCKKPIQKEFYRTLNRFACAGCARQVRRVMEQNVMTAGPLLLAAAAGLLVGMGCAVAWAVIVHVSHFELGIVASFIGVAVGKTVHRAAGKRRGTAFQWLAALLSVVGVVGGKLILVGWQIADLRSARSLNISLPKLVQVLVLLLQTEPSAVIRGFDLLWMGIAAYAAWRLCKAPPITLAGPFPLAPPSRGTLQFDSVEPANTSPTSETP